MGIGLWTPTYPDLAAWARNAPGAPASTPPAGLLPAALRRRAGLMCRAVAEVTGQAAAEGGADLSRTPVVYGSEFGETGAAVEMMRAFTVGEGLPSPTTFHNSVHNAPPGYISIATGCHAFSTSLSAGESTTAMAFLEAWAVLRQNGGDVIVALADEPVPAPLGVPDAYPVAAVAFHLRSTPAGHGRARIGLPRRGPASPLAIHGGLSRHPCAPAFRLALAVDRRHSGTVSLGSGAADDWTIDVEVME